MPEETFSEDDMRAMIEVAFETGYNYARERVLEPKNQRMVDVSKPVPRKELEARLPEALQDDQVFYARLKQLWEDRRIIFQSAN